MEDPAFHISGIGIINTILNYFYVGLVVVCFILALGNRPQGSRWFYTFALVGFAIITIYMSVAALLLAFKGIALLVSENGGKALDMGDFFKNAIFRNIVLSMVATLGLYIFASLIFVSHPLTLSLSFR